MKILIACEESQVVCQQFRLLGHEAVSVDLKPGKINKDWHIQGDVLPFLSYHWDMIIAFPPCTDLAVSGARWFKEKRENGQQHKSIEFFMQFANANSEKIAIENPVGIMSTIWRKPDQIIQPYEFGHPETKKTCLWLKGLPKLSGTDNVYDYMMTLPKKERNRIHYMNPSSSRGELRSKTYLNIAKAMAEQWG